MASSHPPVRVALYARVSTFAGQDPEMQLRELREYCERRKLQIVEEYVDKGVSGSRERRPALDRLRIACGKRLVDAVVVYRYDRFARSLRQPVNDHITGLRVDVDLGSIRPGEYSLGVRQSSLEWTRYPIRVF